ncbi:MAG: tripartite tricarboxylate transporter substrate binding protein [Betaproteobacteria bacterium]|nr:tripartite tricarboxylate transporter substrate binding protein [Betaproteobacteria bacterium]
MGNPQTPSRARRAFTRTTLGLSLLAAGHPAGAQGDGAEYPSRTVTVLVGYPPGNATDTIARLLAERFAARLRRPFIIENRPGQGSSLAAGAVARSNPDGHTLLLTAPAAMAINPALYARVPYDPQRDFAPIGLCSWLPYVLVVRADAGIGSLAELLARARAQPGRLSFSSSGNGTISQLLMVLLSQRTDTQFTHVPYKGSAQAHTDLIGGQVDVNFDTITALMPHIRAGRLRALATSSLTRTPFAPDVPTVAEQGVPGFEGGAWLGFVAAATTPRPILDRLNRELNQILDEADTRRRMTDAGSEILKSTPEEFASFIRAEQLKWARVVKESGTRVD